GLELLLERLRRERPRERVPAGALQPQARVVVDIGVGDRELEPARELDDRGDAGKALGPDLPRRQRQVVALVVRLEAVFLRVVDALRALEGQAGLLGVDRHLLVAQRGLQPIPPPLALPAAP